MEHPQRFFLVLLVITLSGGFLAVRDRGRGPRQPLLRWDVPEDQLRFIEEERQVRPAVVFRSPVAGVVVERTVLNGMHIAAGQTLYRIADLSVVWIEVNFPEVGSGGPVNSLC